MSKENRQVIEPSTWLYSGQRDYDIRIVKHNWRYGRGDCEDDPENREDKQREFYYTEYGSMIERDIYPRHSSMDGLKASNWRRMFILFGIPLLLVIVVALAKMFQQPTIDDER